MHLHYPRTSLPGTGRISYCRSAALGGMTLLSGDEITGAYRPHVHASHVVGIVKRGFLTLTVEGRAHRVGPGNILLINRHQVHEETGAGRSGWSFRYFFLPTACFVKRNTWFAHPVVRDTALAAKLLQLHASICGDCGAVTPESEGRLADLLGKLRPGAGITSASHDDLRRRVTTALRYIHERMPNPTPLRDLARVAGLSPFQVTRACTQLVGLPPHDYYNQLRIASSKELLHEGRPLSEIATLLRYSDQSHFTRKFTATVGVSPGKYALMVGAPGRHFNITDA